MQNRSLYLFLLFPALIFGQTLDCYTTVKEIEQTLKGDWVLVQGLPNQVYRCNLDNATRELIVLNRDINNALVEKRKSVISIYEEQNLFFIRISKPQTMIDHRILFLNENKFISTDARGATTIEYQRLKD